MLEVMREHFVVPKKTHYGTVMRSTGQDKVFVKNDAGIWKHCGYLTHVNRAFLPLVGVPIELVADIAAECAKQINAEVDSVIPPAYDIPLIDGDEDES